MNQSLFFSSETAAGLTDSVQRANDVVLAVALSVFLIVTLAVIAPSVNNVVREQRAVFDVFGRIPVKALRHLRDALTERINQLQRTASGEEDGAVGHGLSALDGAVPGGAGGALAADGGGSGGGAGGGGGDVPGPVDAGARYRGATLAASVSRAKLGEADSPKGPPPLFARPACCRACFSRLLGGGRRGSRSPGESLRVLSTSPGGGGGADGATGAGAAASGGEAPARTFANESRAFRGLFVRLAWPVLAFGSYYVGMFSLRGSMATNAAYAHSAVLWSVELETLSTAVGYNYRNMAWYTEPTWNAAFTAKVQESAVVMASVAEDIASTTSPLPTTTTAPHSPMPSRDERHNPNPA